MTFHVKLNQEETAGFEGFLKAVKPDDVSEDLFIKSLFFLGVDAFQQRLVAEMTDRMDKGDLEIIDGEDNLEELLQNVEEDE